MKAQIQILKQNFLQFPTKELVYQEIMRLGKELPFFDLQWKIEDNLVIGCQSQMYLYGFMKEGNVHFSAYSDALISAGLAAIMLNIYSGQPPEVILLNEPVFLEEMGIISSLSPGRANGLASLYLKMKQVALKLAMQN